MSSSLTSPSSSLPSPSPSLDKLQKMQKGGETNPGQIVFLSSGTVARTKAGSATFFSQLIQFLLPLLAPRKLYCAFQLNLCPDGYLAGLPNICHARGGVAKWSPPKGRFRSLRSPQQLGVWLSGLQAFNWLLVVPLRAFLNRTLHDRQLPAVPKAPKQPTYIYSP